MLKSKIYIWLAVGVLAIGSASLAAANRPLTEIPESYRDLIASIACAPLGEQKPELRYTMIADRILYVEVKAHLDAPLQQDDWKVTVRPAFQPSFHWAPHLTPSDEYIIAQHVLRSPALIVADDVRQFSIVPNLDLLQEQGADWYLDMDAPRNELILGKSRSRVREHVLYIREPGAVHPAGEFTFGFYILKGAPRDPISNPWRNAASFLWYKWGRDAYERHPLQREYLESCTGHAYRWAFESWRDSVWQEFELEGRRVGAPVFIVNVTQSPNYNGPINEREFRSIWNQAWFSSLRSAQGLYRHARRLDDAALLRHALMTKELALSFPQKNGFFPSVIATEMEKIEVDGKDVNRSKGWDTHYFGNSNRNPYTGDPRLAPYHLLDMSFTAYQMLSWYQELEADERLLDYAVKYADALLGVQAKDEFFPGWLSLDTLEPMQHLNQSPESAMSVSFLLKLHALTGTTKYRAAALKAMDAILEHVVPVGQWEDFETYWSCSRYGSRDLVGRKIERNNQFKQNTLSMFWVAEALLHSYRVTGETDYLRWGERVMDELLMYQAVWQPPYAYVDVAGGFAVMNADGEWLDARQSLFAELILEYGLELKRREYVQRARAALGASFRMMYAPENPATQAQWEKAWPFFNEKDYGFMMENYGHMGNTSPEGIGIGDFTIYDWGNGAAAEAFNRMLDRHGDLLFMIEK